MLSLYSTLVLPYLNYGILAWGNCCTSQLNRILLLQKKSMRIVSKVHYLAHTDSLFRLHKVLKICDIYRLNLATLAFQFHNHELPSIFNHMFTFNNEVHHYPTRQIDLYHLPRTRTVFAQDTFTFAAPKLWNSLPQSIRELRNFVTFKSKLKKEFITAYGT